jgi:hypothetical protein
VCNADWEGKKEISCLDCGTDARSSIVGRCRRVETCERDRGGRDILRHSPGNLADLRFGRLTALAVGGVGAGSLPALNLVLGTGFALLQVEFSSQQKTVHVQSRDATYS